MGKLIVFEGTDGTGKIHAVRAPDHAAADARTSPFRTSAVFPQYLRAVVRPHPDVSRRRVRRRPERTSTPTRPRPSTPSTATRPIRDVWKRRITRNGRPHPLRPLYDLQRRPPGREGARGQRRARKFFAWLYDLEYRRMGLPEAGPRALCLDVPAELAPRRSCARREQRCTGTQADIHERNDKYLHQLPRGRAAGRSLLRLDGRLLRERREAPLDRGYP